MEYTRRHIAENSQIHMNSRCSGRKIVVKYGVTMHILVVVIRATKRERLEAKSVGNIDFDLRFYYITFYNMIWVSFSVDTNRQDDLHYLLCYIST
jgi:hypothetical protein